MTEAVLEKNEGLQARLIELGNSTERVGPEWFRRKQVRALERFRQIGFPTRKEESWKYTDLRPMQRLNFSPAEPVSVSSDQIASLRFHDLGCPRLTFINGFFEAKYSTAEMPAGVRCRSLARVLEEDPAFLEDYLAEYPRSEHEAFNCLNWAFLRDGAVVEIAAGTVVDQPLQVLFLSTAVEGSPVITQPRLIVSCGENAQAQIIETHLGLEGGPYFSNAVTEIVAADGAVVDHYKLQQERGQSFHIASLQVRQGRNSNVRTMTITLSGGIVRNESNACLDGEGSWAELNGLYLVGEDHHVDNFTRIDHAQPHCESREVYKGILADRATGVFRGRIVVARNAQKTDSKQTNNNLLLSDEALVNTKPELEIYADDVKCTHGATIGRLDEDAVFYLRARGISQKAAQSMLVYAFAIEVVNKIRPECLRKDLDNYLFEWLPRGELIRDAF